MVLEIALGIVLGVGLLLLIRHVIEAVCLIPWDLVGYIAVIALGVSFFFWTWIHPGGFEEIGAPLLAWGVPPVFLLWLALLYYGIKYLPAILLLKWIWVKLKKQYGERTWFIILKAPFGKGWLGIPNIIAWPVAILMGFLVSVPLIGFLLLIIIVIYKNIVS